MSKKAIGEICCGLSTYLVTIKCKEDFGGGLNETSDFLYALRLPELDTYRSYTVCITGANLSEMIANIEDIISEVAYIENIKISGEIILYTNDPTKHIQTGK